MNKQQSSSTPSGKKRFTVFLLSLVYIAVFTFLDDKGVSLSSIKKNVDLLISAGNAGRMVKTGPDTYSIRFATDEEGKEGATPGILVKGGNSYSHGFEFRLKEFFTDSLAVIKTQARFRRMSTDSLSVLFVISLETPGQPKTFWAASYGLDHEIGADTVSILNGRLKTEGFPITGETILKGYMWNTGKSAVLLSELSITLGTDPAPKGDTTLIQQMEGDRLKTGSGFQPYLPKTRLRPLTENAFENMVQAEQAAVLATLNNDILQTGKTRSMLFTNHPATAKVWVENSKEESTRIATYIRSGLYLLPEFTQGNQVKGHQIIDGKGSPCELALPRSEEWILSRSALPVEDTHPLWLNKKATVFYDPGETKNQGTCIFKDGVKIEKVISCVFLGEQHYLLHAVDPNKVLRTFIGSVELNTIRFSPLTFQNKWTENLLSPSSDDQYFRIGSTTFLVLCKGWRHGLFKISIGASGRVQILQSYFPEGKPGTQSPFYYENVNGAYLPKSGKLLLTARQIQPSGRRSENDKYKKPIVLLYAID